jgi:SAM-dependent methyltransferase
MLSCPERTAMRERTLDNLSRTDWQARPVIVLDQGPSESKRDRQTHAALSALRAGIADRCEFILFLEDDLDFNCSLRHNLESWIPLRSVRPGGHLFASLYNPNIAVRERRPEESYFIAPAEAIYGSQAYILSHATACYLAEHWDEVTGMQDIRMSRLAGRLGPIYYHIPSLVQHVGQQSVWGGGFHTAGDFDRDWKANQVSRSYDREFFLSLEPGSLQSARVIVPLVLNLLRVVRVIDVGCATGAWLKVMREHGIEDAWGVEGYEVEIDRLLVPPERVLRRDLSREFRTDFQSDLVICLEVAEHLPPAAARGFVQSLASLGPVILFSAAIPGQGGFCHVNEQWPEYWAQLFAECGFEAVDCIRRRVWDDPAVCFWYRQNVLLFAHECYLHAHPDLRKLGASSPLALVHPELYLMKCR